LRGINIRRIPCHEEIRSGNCVFALVKKEKTLANGLHVIAVKKDKLPIFHMQLTVRVGSLLDPEGKEGLANLVGVMVDEGTKNRTSRTTPTACWP